MLIRSLSSVAAFPAAAFSAKAVDGSKVKVRDTRGSAPPLHHSLPFYHFFAFPSFFARFELAEALPLAKALSLALFSSFFFDWLGGGYEVLMPLVAHTTARHTVFCVFRIKVFSVFKSWVFGLRIMTAPPVEDILLWKPSYSQMS